MRIPTQNISRLVAGLNSINARQTTISQQMSTGSRIPSLGVDPAAAGQSSQLASSVRTADSFIQTASTVTSRMQAADSALSSVVSALSGAITLAVQASNATINSANMQSLAQQLAGIRDQVLTTANASYQGTYLFAGTAGDTQPFVQSAGGSVTYAGDGNQAALNTHDGATIAVGISGSEAFGTGSPTDVFAALNRVIVQLNSGHQLSADDIGTLRSSFDNVLAARSTIDTDINRLTRASDFATAEKTQQTISQSALISADVAQLATELSAGETQRSALMSTIAVVQKGSLFDYL